MSISRDKVSVLQRALLRERLARASAEQLLESKSSELYETNQRLSDAREALEQKVSERTAELQDARDEAVRLMEDRMIFLARISHELRTPLNSILGIVQIMLQEESREATSRKLETVNASSNVLLTMINKILDFTKLEAGESAVESVECHVGGLLDDAVDMLAQTAAGKGVALYVQKRAGSPNRIMSDPSRLTQILLNLLSNAVKFTSEGSVTVNLDVLSEPSPQLVLTVRDTGVGIHPEGLESIFLPFKQSPEGRSVHSGGTGLGLSIVKHSVQLLGGDIEATSEMGKGSIFTVRLPIVLASAESDLVNVKNEPADIVSDDVRSRHPRPSARSVSALPSYQGMGKSNPLRILVADDNEMNRSVIEMQLEYLGYRGDYVANGEEVVRAVSAHQYDVVLMDISMPIMNGEDACKAIRSMTKIEQPIVVAVTASALSGDRERYLKNGMDHYLAKPVDSVELAKYLKWISDDIVASKSLGKTVTLQASSTSDKQFIDLDELAGRLGEMLQPMLLKVAPVFLSELPGRLLRLQAAFETDSAEDLIAMIHALKGSASSVGGSLMANYYDEREAQLRLGRVLSESELEELVDCAQQTAKALEQVLSELPS